MNASLDICSRFRTQMMDQKIRLRFAPSPTGPLHIGGIRTALYNYLFARKNQGRFILRIEDTDQARYVPGAESFIVESLQWLGLIPDEGPGFGGDFGPYRQSERKAIYMDHAIQLMARGEAYYAFDSETELETLRASDGGNQKYDFNTRNGMRNSITLGPEKTQALLDACEPFVIRLKVPENQDIVIEDMVRGKVQFNTADLDDKVLIKSDGMPTYHMANVVDDRLMEISHVIRGEEWLSSTAHHVLLYRAFGWEDRMPRFAHLPLILKPVGNGKLSKRDGAQFGFPVFPISWKTPEGESFIGFREYGFEPNALLNFLALLGWNDGTEKEIFSIEEMIQAFSLEKIVKSGARFDFDKGKWFNQQYLHQLPEEECIERIKNDFEGHGITLLTEEARDLYHLYHDRVLLSKDYFDLGKVYFTGVERYDSDYLSKKFKPEFIPALKEVVFMLEALNDWNPTDIESGLKNLIQGGMIKPGELFPLLRVVMSGLPTGPDVFKMTAFTGKTRLRQRMDSFLHHLNV